MVVASTSGSSADLSLDLPRFSRYEAPPHWESIDFLSDLHLQESTPRTFAALEAHLFGTTADAVFILGDLFEAWVGDDARFEGFEKRCAALLAAAAKVRPVAFMAGNRDFLVGADLLDSCGVAALHDPTVLSAFGHHVLLTHGDALCLDDREYQRFRAQVRQPAWQQAVLARPLPERRALARQIRDASEQRRQQGHDVEGYGDLDPAAMIHWMQAAGAPVLVHGHTHRPAHQALGHGCERWVLSDWDFDGTSPRGDVLRLSRAGLERIPIAAAAP
jgi:UDP-2,3-diacylglucosamine hydrolase